VVALITLATDLGLGLVQRAVNPEGLKRDASSTPTRSKRLTAIPIPRRTQTP
jgi:hypothetical protein